MMKLKRSRNIGGKNTSPYIYAAIAFNGNIKILTSGGSGNAREKQGQREGSKDKETVSSCTKKQQES